MIGIKEYLDGLRDGNKLKDYVIDYYIDDYDSYSDDESFIKGMEDLQRYGCVSGMIGSLIYYDDTNKFYDKYKEEINELLSNLIEGTGLSMQELFGDKFDNEDPLVLDYSNKNLLAWFGFEETANSLYEQVNENYKRNDAEFAF